MLAKIAPRFVISRVIQHAYFADMMSIQLLKQPFTTHEDYFGITDAHHYYQCKFYGYISTLTAPTEFTSQYEAETYYKSCQKFKQFNEVLALVQKISDFTQQLQKLYAIIQRDNTTSNIFAQHKQSLQQWQKDVLDAISRYNTFIDALEPYPEWKNKVSQQVGSYLHLIHNNLAESERKRKIFLQMNRQEYFI